MKNGKMNKSGRNIEIKDKNIYINREQYIHQKFEGQLVMWLLLLPMIVLIIISLSSGSMPLIVLATVGLLVIISYLGLKLLRLWIAQEDTKVGVDDRSDVQLSELLPKGKASYKFAFENGILRWYPYLNRKTYLEIAQEDIEELTFGWGIIE